VDQSLSNFIRSTWEGTL